jgi:hypothetical protein
MALLSVVFSFVSINKKYDKGWPESVTQANHFFYADVAVQV